MKRSLALVFLVNTVFLFSQQEVYFELIHLGNRYNPQQISSTFNQANLCGYFKANASVNLTLDDSTIIRLKKKSDLEQIGIYLESDCFDIKNFQPQSEIWRISDSILICEKKRQNSKFIND